MKLSRIFLMAIVAISLAATGCNKDNDDPKDDKNEPEPYDIIVGNWRAPEVSPLLVDIVDSIHVEFKDNQTYVVKSYKDEAIVLLEGTYSTEDGVGDIRNIVLNQNTPTSLTSEGIYQIEGDKLTYEVAQTEPAQTGVTAPTAEAGFGSTSGGLFGTTNVQVYYKMDKE